MVVMSVCVAVGWRLVGGWPQDDEVQAERVSREAFIDFLLGVLDLDPRTRWTPRQVRGLRREVHVQLDLVSRHAGGVGWARLPPARALGPRTRWTPRQVWQGRRQAYRALRGTSASGRSHLACEGLRRRQPLSCGWDVDARSGGNESVRRCGLCTYPRRPPGTPSSPAPPSPAPPNPSPTPAPPWLRSPPTLPRNSPPPPRSPPRPPPPPPQRSPRPRRPPPCKTLLGRSWRRQAPGSTGPSPTPATPPPPPPPTGPPCAKPRQGLPPRRRRTPLLPRPWRWACRWVAWGRRRRSSSSSSSSSRLWRGRFRPRSSWGRRTSARRWRAFRRRSTCTAPAGRRRGPRCGTRSSSSAAGAAAARPR